jgi:FtsZ-interacting cell division protein ZipA
MNSNILIPIIIVVAVIILAIVIAGMMRRKKHSDQLRNKFGPEYDYAIKTERDARKAEQSLEEREKHVSELKIHSLDENLRSQYSAEWMDIQTKFVDDPKGAVNQANRLITEVMVARGFPVEDFEQRAADLSVLYPEFVPNYRNAYAISSKNENDENSTEDLRQAMVYYHEMFDELLGTEPTREMESMK